MTASNDCIDGCSVVEGGAWQEDTAAADGHHVTGCASRNARILQQQPSRARRGAARRLHHLHTMNGTGAALRTPRLHFYQSPVYGDLVEHVLLAHQTPPRLHTSQFTSGAAYGLLTSVIKKTRTYNTSNKSRPFFTKRIYFYCQNDGLLRGVVSSVTALYSSVLVFESR